MKAVISKGGLLPIRNLFASVLTLAVLVLSGCRTYYGYTDVRKDVFTPMPDSAPREERVYAVLTMENGNASLKCFRRFTLPKNTMKESRIVGRREWYRDYEAMYYFENSPYNAGWSKDAWLFPRCLERTVKRKDKRDQPLFFLLSDDFDGNPFLYLTPVAGQIALGWDLSLFMVASCVDSCLFITRCCWTGISIPCAWFWGRCVRGFTDDWHLTEHKPGVLQLLGYTPIISLFMLQTPPYATDDASYSVDVEYAAEAQKILTRTRIVELNPKQELCSRYRVNAEVFCGSRSCGRKEFMTSVLGEVSLTGFLRDCVNAVPFTRRDFSLKVELCGNSGKVLLTRNVDFRSEYVMSPEAANDLAAYRSDRIDCLNRLLLSRRSHSEWRQEVFADDLAPRKQAEIK